MAGDLMPDITTLVQVFTEVYGPAFPLIATIIIVAFLVLAIFAALVMFAFSRL